MSETYPQTPEIDGSSIQILLVEDDETDAKLVKIYAGAIPNTQITVDWVKSTREAQARLENKSYDLCIFDFWLRTHTSMQLLQEVRTLHDALPIIILSHMTNQHMLEMSVDAGAFYVLGKDELNVSTLGAAIDQLLFEDDPARVRLPSRPREKVRLKPVAREVASKLTHIHDNMREIYGPDRDETSEAPEPSAIDHLQGEVAILRLEWQASLRAEANTDRISNLDYHDIADLIAHALSAMTPIIERQDQNWLFEAPKAPIRVKCDPIIVMLMLMEQIYAVSSISKFDGTMLIDLARHSGRPAVTMSCKTEAPPRWSSVTLPSFFAPHLGPRGFDFRTGTTAQNGAQAQLLFPHLLN